MENLNPTGHMPTFSLEGRQKDHGDNAIPADLELKLQAVHIQHDRPYNQH